MSDILTDKQTFFFPICNKCKSHIEGVKCKAFDKIPNEIILGKNNHSKPLKIQGNDIVFEPLPEKD